jgi:hypothetical protein
MKIELFANITCPECGHTTREEMPVSYCVIQYNCPNCKATMRPQAGDCCVYCSYADVKCPSIQEETLAQDKG